MASADVTVKITLDTSAFEAALDDMRHRYPDWFLTPIGDVLPPRYTFRRSLLILHVRLARVLRLP